MVLAANVIRSFLALVVLDLGLAADQQQDHHGSTTVVGSTDSTSIDVTTTSITSAAATTVSSYVSTPIPTPTAKSTAKTTASVCEARTINYITHSLPQLCYTSTWSGTSVVGTTTSNEMSGSSAADADPISTGNTKAQTATAQPVESSTSSDDEPTATPFMSFEDWKEMMLRRQGQDPQDLKQRKPGRNRGGNDRNPLPDMGNAGLGEEGEISLDFDEYLDKPQGNYGHDQSYGGHGDYEGEGDGHDELVPREGMDPAVDYRSKDAGKTCKERFSYSSFDAGATIVKTSQGAKNPKAILVENKDSYMLLECAAESKYVIVELSDDVLVDTVVLANFEFFSSMIRHFRVSVSALYPVKSEHWRELGVFEARNSRDIQPFLVENPQMWAKYVRIEFLTQYGKEYYCPVSLIRIHGSRMLDRWKEEYSQAEAITEGGEEGTQVLEDGSPEPEQPEEPSPVVEKPVDDVLELADTSPYWSSSANLFNSSFLLCSLCSPEDIPTQNLQGKEASTPESDGKQRHATDVEPRKSDLAALRDTASQAPIPEKLPHSTSALSAPSSTVANTTRNVVSSNSTTVNSSPSTGEVGNSNKSNNSSSPSPTKTTNPSSSGSKHRGTASAASASPTVQESFFNAITKRLNNVESNLTLSLQYLEDHSRYLQEFFQVAEQKQVAKVANFLDNLNATVFSELRGMRDQYEQIWQSTVIALDSQREQSERDIIALGTRLNLLADEVVFQKRMAIVQAVLLLCCLFLVIFSRGVPIPYLAPLLDQQNNPITPYTSTSPQTQSAILHARGNTPTEYSPPSGIRTPLESMQEGVPLSDKTFADMPPSDRLSPPLTPGSIADSERSVASGASLDLQAPAPNLRRSLSSQHHARKPLPALPEHPSPL